MREIVEQVQWMVGCEETFTTSDKTAQIKKESWWKNYPSVVHSVHHKDKSPDLQLIH